MTVPAVEPKARPIIFSGPMVRAILAGTKTQTRRVMKPQPVENPKWHGGWVWRTAKASTALASINLGGVYADLCPYGRPGDLLWVRETHRSWHPHGFHVIEYRADGGHVDDEPWTPSIHMRKEYARLWLRVIDVRVERLHDIMEADAIAEGSQVPLDEIHPRPQAALSERHAFVHLWDSINAGRGYGWDTNPWVWVVSFERTEAPA